MRYLPTSGTWRVQFLDFCASVSIYDGFCLRTGRFCEAQLIELAHRLFAHHASVMQIRGSAMNGFERITLKSGFIHCKASVITPTPD